MVHNIHSTIWNKPRTTNNDRSENIAIVIWLSFTVLQFLQAYSFTEIFCGTAWVSRVMRADGRYTAQMDILLTEPEMKQSAQNPMNLLTDCGFLLLG